MSQGVADLARPNGAWPDPVERDLDLVVVGGGIAGLCAAFEGHRRGWRVRLLESGGHLGGKLRSEQRDGFVCEWGANSFVNSAKMIWTLIDALGLQDEVVRAQGPQTRFVFRDRKARALPRGPTTLFGGDYLSLTGKLRLLLEPLVMGEAREQDSVLDFARRRLGEEAARYLVAPFVSGVYAGDPEQLGARDAFPKLWQWERDAGSLVMGALLDGVPSDGAIEDSSLAAHVATHERRGGLYSFRSGLERLPQALAASLPPGTIRDHAKVTAVESAPGGGYVVRVVEPRPPHDRMSLHAQRVIVATPPRAAAPLLADVPAVTAVLSRIEVCRIAVVHLGGPDPEGLAPSGFGVLIPRGEGLRTLGILFPSSVFPGRAPKGHWLHTGFLGGVLDPDVVDLPDENLVELVKRAQQQAFGHRHPGRELTCTYSTVVRWREAIPQYHIGYRQSMQKAISELESARPGLTLAGNHVDGVSVDAAAQSGVAAVVRLARQRSGEAALGARS